MKKTSILIVCIILFLLSACGGKEANRGNIENVDIPDWIPSDIYTDDEIESAFQTVMDYFSQEFDGCTLTKLYYPGDTFADEFSEWAAQYETEEAIVIYSDFDVDSFGGDGSLEPNTTYEDWSWVLVRDAGGEWKLVTNGYG